MPAGTETAPSTTETKLFDLNFQLTERKLSKPKTTNIMLSPLPTNALLFALCARTKVAVVVVVTRIVSFHLYLYLCYMIYSCSYNILSEKWKDARTRQRRAMIMLLTVRPDNRSWRPSRFSIKCRFAKQTEATGSKDNSFK